MIPLDGNYCNEDIEMEDRELLRLAAKAIGLKVDLMWSVNPDGTWSNFLDCEGRTWRVRNPMAEDRDAFGLAVSLRMDILQDERSISIKKWCQVKCESIFLAEQPIDGCRSAATRAALVRAAAEIGKQMP
jgi:hypothetical protein